MRKFLNQRFRFFACSCLLLILAQGCGQGLHFSTSTTASGGYSPRVTDTSWAFDSGASTSTVTINRPVAPNGGIQTGDLIVAAIYIATAAAAVTPPAGFNPLFDDNVAGDPRLLTYWKIATSSEPASYSWSLSVSSGSSAAALAAYSATWQSSPVDVSSHIAGVANPQTVPSITTTADNDLEILVVALFNPTTFNTPTGWTLRAANDVLTATDPIAIYDKVDTVGAQGTVDMSFGMTFRNIEHRFTFFTPPVIPPATPPNFVRQSLRFQ